MTNYRHISAIVFYYITRKKTKLLLQPFYYNYINLIKNKIMFFYSNRINIINFLEDDASAKLYRLLLLDFKKFIRLKKEFTNKELRKLLPKRYYDFINFYLQKNVNTLLLYWPNNYTINLK